MGPMAYLKPKGGGERSMPENQRPGPDVWDGAPRGPRDMAKPGLVEAQFPEGVYAHPSERRLEPMPCPATTPHDGRRNLQSMGRSLTKGFKGMNGMLKSRYYVHRGRTRDHLRGEVPYGDGGPVVVAGVTSCQGGRESRPQGQGGQAVRMFEPWGYA